MTTDQEFDEIFCSLFDLLRLSGRTLRRLRMETDSMICIAGDLIEAGDDTKRHLTSALERQKMLCRHLVATTETRFEMIGELLHQLAESLLEKPYVRFPESRQDD